MLFSWCLSFVDNAVRCAIVAPPSEGVHFRTSDFACRNVLQNAGFVGTGGAWSVGAWSNVAQTFSPMPLGIEGVEPLPNAVWPLSGRDFNAGTTAIRLPSPRRDDRSRQLRRSGMFIAREPNQDPRKPQRGGVVARGGRHAAPTELEEIRGGGAVAINMPLLRSLALAEPRVCCRSASQSGSDLPDIGEKSCFWG
jgi:hypothetical protein